MQIDKIRNASENVVWTFISEDLAESLFLDMLGGALRKSYPPRSEMVAGPIVEEEDASLINPDSEPEGDEGKNPYYEPDDIMSKKPCPEPHMGNPYFDDDPTKNDPCS